MKNEASDIIEHTLNFWGKRTGKDLSREDAREMVANVSGFFQVLAEWDRKARMEACSEDGEKIGLDEMTRRREMPCKNGAGRGPVLGKLHPE